jgi:hypothetical protein
VKDLREPMMVYNSILGNWEEEVVRGPGFEKMGVATLI